MADADAESEVQTNDDEKQIEEGSEEMNFASEHEPERVPYYIEHLPE